MAKGKLYFIESTKRNDGLVQYGWLDEWVSDGNSEYTKLSEIGRVSLDNISEGEVSSDYNDETSIEKLRELGFNVAVQVGVKGISSYVEFGGDDGDDDDLLDELAADPKFKFTANNVVEHACVPNYFFREDGGNVFIVPPAVKPSTLPVVNKLVIPDTELTKIVKIGNKELEGRRKKLAKAKTTEGQIIAQIKKLQADLAKIK